MKLNVILEPSEEGGYTITVPSRLAASRKENHCKSTFTVKLNAFWILTLIINLFFCFLQTKQ